MNLSELLGSCLSLSRVRDAGEGDVDVDDVNVTTTESPLVPDYSRDSFERLSEFITASYIVNVVEMQLSSNERSHWCEKCMESLGLLGNSEEPANEDVRELLRSDVLFQDLIDKGFCTPLQVCVFLDKEMPLSERRSLIDYVIQSVEA